MKRSPGTPSPGAVAARGIRRTISDKVFAKTVARVIEVLKAEGFGVLTEIDEQATTKAKLCTAGRPYCILGACHPALGHRALGAEPDFGLLLPCNVILSEEADGRLLVAFMDPVAVQQMTRNPEVAQVAHELHERLQRVKARLNLPSRCPTTEVHGDAHVL